jgi:hypothetical protein
MIRNFSTPDVVLTVKPSVAIRTDQKLSKLTVALSGLGSRIVYFDAARKPHGGYEALVFKSDSEDGVRAIIGNSGFTVTGRRSN